MPIIDPFYKIPDEGLKKGPIDSRLRSYQEWVYWSTQGVLVLHWARQIGKSFTLGAWAVFRLVEYPGRLVTVLSNSKQNGIEFIMAAGKIAEMMGLAMEKVGMDETKAGSVENMRMEIRLKIGKRIGRIIVLSANPRTARGFSGDLILDEFAFHENSAAIWDAAEPIISSNQDFQCRISSTGNGRFNMFYRMANPTSEFDVARVRRSEAVKMGVKIYDLKTRKVITAAQARAAAADKASYDQNYECAFNDEASALLTHELINACEYQPDPQDPNCFICEGAWSSDALDYLRGCLGPLGVGVDIGRTRNLTFISVGEKIGGVLFVRAILRLESMRLPAQLEHLKPVLAMRHFGRFSGDSTGIGLGLVEFAQEQPGVGQHRAEAVNFATKEKREVGTSEQEDSALVTELMALDLLKVFEDHQIRIPPEQELRDDLRKPQRMTTGKGAVRIAATDDAAGHADGFWSLALLVRALKSRVSAFAYEVASQEDNVPRLFNRRDSRRSIALI